jgi:hypothetical protein
MDMTDRNRFFISEITKINKQGCDLFLEAGNELAQIDNEIRNLPKKASKPSNGGGCSIM